MSDNKIPAPKAMDPNLVKIRDDSYHLIKQKKFAKTIAQAKDYLANILGEYRSSEMNRELDYFVAHIKNIAQRS